jgi:hypothetical protein
MEVDLQYQLSRMRGILEEQVLRIQRRMRQRLKMMTGMTAGMRTMTIPVQLLKRRYVNGCFEDYYEWSVLQWGT